MRKYGVGKNVYGIFLVRFSIVFISILLLYWLSDDNVTKWMYILFGLFISVVQAAVAYANKHGRMNKISQLMLSCLRFLMGR